jgi:hypothetical protein
VKRRTISVVVIVLILGVAYWLYQYLEQALSGVQ